MVGLRCRTRPRSVAGNQFFGADMAHFSRQSGRRGHFPSTRSDQTSAIEFSAMGLVGQTSSGPRQKSVGIARASRRNATTSYDLADGTTSCGFYARFLETIALLAGHR